MLIIDIIDDLDVKFLKSLLKAIIKQAILDLQHTSYSKSAQSFLLSDTCRMFCEYCNLDYNYLIRRLKQGVKFAHGYYRIGNSWRRRWKATTTHNKKWTRVYSKQNSKV